MNTRILLLSLACTCMAFKSMAQRDSFDVFTFQPPEFFTKALVPSGVRFVSTNNDSSFCIITLYKSSTGQGDHLKNAECQWQEYVVKTSARPSNKPLQTWSGKYQDGWKTVLCIGNFYRNKKKCLVLLYSFSYGNITACIVYQFSDRIYKGPIEQFSKELHLISP